MKTRSTSTQNYMEEKISNSSDSVAKPVANGAERRYLPRWEVNNRVLCRTDADLDLPHECRSVDLSCSGVGLVARDKIEPQQKVKLTIYLTESKAIEVEGRVVWHKLSLYGHLAGVIFENAPSDIQDTILRYAFEFKKRDVINHWYEGWGGEKKS